MEEHSQSLHFETNPYHNLIIKDRKIIEITGVKQMDSFDENEFLLETSQGWLMIQGKGLKLGKLDTQRGDVVIHGSIQSLAYIANKKENTKESMMSKLFK